MNRTLGKLYVLEYVEGQKVTKHICHENSHQIRLKIFYFALAARKPVWQSDNTFIDEGCIKNRDLEERIVSDYGHTP